MNVSIQLKQFKRINNHKHYNMNLKNKELELKKKIIQTSVIIKSMN